MHNQLKHLRKEAKLTQSQLAKRLGDGYSRSHICNIEKGKRAVGLAFIERWAESCGFRIEVGFHKKTQDNEIL